MTQTQCDKQVLHDIEKYGWHVVKIMEDESGPGFCFSIGLYETFKHPEIIIIGLKPELAHTLINNIGESIREGKFYDINKPHQDILNDFDCYMLEVDKKYYDEYLGYAIWYYKGKDFPANQCVYPTVKGIYPWQNDWPEEIRDLQPLLGSVDEIAKT